MFNGDAAAMREALNVVYNSLHDHAIIYPKERWRLVGIIDAAIAKPPRNCDVGTAEEQFERWEVFCAKYDNDCTGCPCDDNTCTFANCFAKWAQMPYEEGGAK